MDDTQNKQHKSTDEIHKITSLVHRAVFANLINLKEEDIWEITKQGTEISLAPAVSKKAIGALFHCVVSNDTTIGEIMNILENKRKYVTTRGNIVWSCHKVANSNFDVEELYVYR